MGSGDKSTETRDSNSQRVVREAGIMTAVAPRIRVAARRMNTATLCRGSISNCICLTCDVDRGSSDGYATIPARTLHSQTPITSVKGVSVQGRRQVDHVQIGAEALVGVVCKVDPRLDGVPVYSNTLILDQIW